VSRWNQRNIEIPHSTSKEPVPPGCIMLSIPVKTVFMLGPHERTKYVRCNLERGIHSIRRSLWRAQRTYFVRSCVGLSLNAVIWQGEKTYRAKNGCCLFETSFNVCHTSTRQPYGRKVVCVFTSSSVWRLQTLVTVWWWPGGDTLLLLVRIEQMLTSLFILYSRK
jgi:hypothetical protein